MAKKVLVIGATGHVGSYLIPRLVDAGFDVVTMSRGRGKPYFDSERWKAVEQIAIDRTAAEADGSFVGRVKAVNADIVIDMICFTPESAKALAEGLNGHIEHFIHTGTIWTHGTLTEVPVTEDAPKRPFGDYGIKKAAIEEYLLGQARLNGFPTTLVHPGHIVGRGWRPVNPAGNISWAVWKTIARGETLALPNLGLETVHHIHADDIATLFLAIINHWSISVGESFHAVSEKALTLRGYAEAMYRWFGKEPSLTFAPFDEWAKNCESEDARTTWDHIAHSPNCSMEKAARLLGYRPRYSSLEAVQDSVRWLIESGELEL